MARITYRKTRKGETIDIRADKGEDLRGVVAAMAKSPRPTVKHAQGFAPDGSRWVSPPIQLCTGRERLEGSRIAISDEYVTCSSCARILANVPTDKVERKAWVAKHGIALNARSLK